MIRRVASLGQRLAGISAAIAAGALGSAAACTVFNGLTPTTRTDASPPADAMPPGDAVPDIAAEAHPDAGPVPLNYLTVAQGAALCSLATSCPLLSSTIQISVGVPIDANNYSLCMEWAAGPIPGTRQGFTIQQAVLQCMAAATSCTAAAACAVYENIPPGDPRCKAPMNPDGGNLCLDNATSVNCSTGYAEHCGAGGYTPGASCNLGSDGLTACSLSSLEAGCVGNLSCIGTFEDFCGLDGLHIRYNCETFGDPCVYGEAGAQCGEACFTTGALICDGDVVKSCDGTEQSPFVCSDMGGTCASKQNAIYCARPGDSCTPLDSDVNVCTGTSLALCIGGAKTSFDCASISKQCLPGVIPQTPHCG
jgi:hypothetical protein